MTGKKATLFYHNWLPLLRKLTKEQVGELTLALLEYDANGQQPEFSDPMVDLAFTNYVQVVDMDREKYTQQVEKNRENGKKGGRPKNPTVSKKTERFFEKPKKADIDIDMDIDNDIDIDMDIDMDIERGMDINISPPRPDSLNQDQQIARIIEAWNRQKCIMAPIDRITPLSRRYNNTFLSIAEFGFDEFLNQINTLDRNKFFEDWHPNYDWFCDPNNFIKVLEGNYLEGKIKVIDKNSKEYWDSL